MGLLLADLQGFVNGARSDGGRAVLPRVLPPVLLGGMYWLLGRLLLEEPQLLRLVHRGGDSLQLLFGTALGPCPVVAGWVGLAHAQRQLFEAPELQLWLRAPVWSGRAALQVLLRAIGTAMLWASALCLPLLVQLFAATERGPGATGAGVAGALPAMLLAIATAVLPFLCLAVAVQIVLLRLARGPLTRLLLSASGTLAAFGFPVFLLLQVFTGAPSRAEELVASARDGSTGPGLAAPAAAALADVARGLPLAPHLQALLAPAGIGLLLFLLVAPLHPVALQHHEQAERRRRWFTRAWPHRPLASLRRKEFAQLRHQRGALLHMLLVGAMVLVLAKERVVGDGIAGLLFLDTGIRQVAQMLVFWFLAVLMLLYAHSGRFAAWDGAQWPLYLRAPIRVRTLLFAKLQAIALLLVWPIAVAAVAGVQFLAASWHALGAFAALAVAGSLVALGVVAAVGTMPWLLRRELDGTLQTGARGLAGSIVLVVGFELAMVPAFAWWILFVQRAQRSGGVAELAAVLPEALQLAFALGAVLVLLGCAVAFRNYRRLLAPR